MDTDSRTKNCDALEFPTYIVEELNVCGSEALDWETTREKTGDHAGELYIKEYLGSKKHIVLPAYINGEKVAGVYSSGLRGCQAEIIEIPGSYEKVDNISDLGYLKKVVIGEGIKSIGFCLEHMPTLQEALVSQSVEVVNGFAFFETPWRTEQEKKDFFIVGRALMRYSGDESTVYVPEGVRSICYEAIWSDKVRKVVLPQTLTTICDEAFALPLNKSITEFVFPDSIKEIGVDAFKETAWLKNFDSDTVIVNGILYRHGAKEKVVTIPQGVVRINENAFRENENIEEVYCPDSLKSIGRYAFYRCVNMRKIVLGNAIEHIEESAFRNCRALETADTDGNTLKSIGDEAFSGCRSLKKIVPSEVIGQKSFRYCDSLEEVWLTPGMEEISAQAFEECSGLKEVHIPDGVKIIKALAFSNCKQLCSVNLPEGLESIYGYAFFGCENLRSITLPGSLKATGGNIFANCTLLEDVDMPEADIEFGEDAFYNTPYLRREFGDFEIRKGVLCKYMGNDVSVELPDTVKEIADGAFSAAPQIETLIIPDSVTAIGADLFGYSVENLIDRFVGKEQSGEPRLKKLVIGNNVTSIERFAFRRCEYLKEVTFGKALSVIGMEAFESCKRLKEIDLSKTSVVEIRHHAFSGCENVKRLLLPDTLETIEACAFEDIHLKKAELPASVKQVGRDAFNTAEEVIIPDAVEFFIDAVKADRRNKYVFEKNAAADGCTITVYSVASGEVKYKLFCAGEEDDEYYKMISAASKEGTPFNFEVYDRYFLEPGNPMTKVKTALCRLTYPYELFPWHRKNYEAYLKRCLYIERGAKRILQAIAEKDDIEDLEFLENYDALFDHSLPWAKDAFTEHNAKKCLEFLERKEREAYWRERNLGDDCKTVKIGATDSEWREMKEILAVDFDKRWRIEKKEYCYPAKDDPNAIISQESDEALKLSKLYPEALFFYKSKGESVCCNRGKEKNQKDALSIRNEMYEEHMKKAMEATDTSAEGLMHIVEIMPGGLVAADGINRFGECDILQWTDVKKISCGNWHTVGIHSDGTLIACGSNANGQCDVGNTGEKVIDIACGRYHTAILTESGKVIIKGHLEPEAPLPGTKAPSDSSSKGLRVPFVVDMYLDRRMPGFEKIKRKIAELERGDELFLKKANGNHKGFDVQNIWGENLGIVYTDNDESIVLMMKKLQFAVEEVCPDRSGGSERYKALRVRGFYNSADPKEDSRLKKLSAAGSYTRTPISDWPPVKRIRSVFDAVIGVTADGRIFVDGFCPCTEADIRRLVGL